MTDLEILQILTKAKEAGVTMEDVEAFKAKQHTVVKDEKAEDMVKPLSVLDDLSEEEILFWATPHYDELQYKKEQQKQKLNEEKQDG